MNFSESIVIVLISQVPLVIYTILSGWRRFKPEVKKLDADTQSSLSNAVEGAGKTLVDAWRRIGELDKQVESQGEELTKLKEDLKKYQKAFARAVLYIRNHLPGQEIPDFFETGEVTEKQ